MRSLKVLVAEDNIINQRLIVELLKKLGHTGVVVADGDKALKCLAKLKFDVVLMDVMMPVLDGVGALQAIREQEVHLGGHQLVIMATSHAEPSDKLRFQQAGADGYLAKPIDAGTLRAELERVVGR